MITQKERLDPIFIPLVERIDILSSDQVVSAAIRRASVSWKHRRRILNGYRHHPTGPGDYRNIASQQLPNSAYEQEYRCEGSVRTSSGDLPSRIYQMLGGVEMVEDKSRCI